MVAGVPLLASKLTLLQMVQNACSELGLNQGAGPYPTQVIGNTDPQITQILALANREGKELYTAGLRKDGWEVLRKEYTFSINAVSGLTGTFTKGSNIVTAVSPNTTGITTLMQIYNTTYFPVGTVVTGTTTNTITVSNVSLAGSPDVGISFFCGQTDYPFPSDMDHFMTQTFWDRNFRWQLLGPLDAQEWQVLKSGISPTGPRRRFRVYGNNFCIDPVPGFSTSDNGSIVAYEYYSNGWCQSTGGTIASTPQQKWTTDTDNYVLDDEAMTLGIIWRYLRAKRLSYDEEKRTYDMLVERLQSRDGANRNLPLNASASGIRLLNSQNVPDTGFGS